MKIVQTDSAPAAIGPYSQAFISGKLVFTSGQIPLDPKTGEMVGGDVAEQTERVITNLKAVLEAAGSSLNNIVKTTCFLSDMNDFARFNEIYAKYFLEKPARSTVAVRQLPKNALVEIEAVAELLRGK
ncbi:MAG: RidA family protein [Treponema sp.]|jgi:2-iminobutanoate/2-iminopropanoate deaminase|nr:RidA family protein [Treponema sp.]